MIVRAENQVLVEGAPKTYLSNLEAAGTNVLRLKNSAGIGSAWAIQIGEIGDETAEVRLLSGTPSGTQGTVTAVTLFEHSADTPVYGIKWNQVVFKRSTTGTAGVASILTNGTVTITPNNWDQAKQKSYTFFDDADGSVSYTYKTFFRNSAIPLTSTDSDWIVVSPDFYSLSVLRTRVKEKLWNSTFVTDDAINSWINEWRDEMNNSLISVNEDYAIGTVDIGFGTSGLGTVTTGDFREPKRVEVTYNGSDFFLSTKRALNEYYPSEVVNSAHPYHNWQGNNVIHVMPSDSAGTARIWFYRTGTPMVNDTDTLDLPMRAYTNSFVNYALGMAYQKDGKAAQAQLKIQDANNQKEMFLRQMAPRDKSGPTYIRLSEVTSGDDNLW